MNSWTDLFQEALETLPSEQRAKFLKFMFSHGLKPDDPSIVCVLLMYMLVRRMTTQLKDIERAVDPHASKTGLAVISMFSQIGRRSIYLTYALATVILLVSSGVGWTVHHIDSAAEHSRLCADEAIWTIQLVDYAHRKGYLQDAYHMVTHKPQDC